MRCVALAVTLLTLTACGDSSSTPTSTPAPADADISAPADADISAAEVTDTQTQPTGRMWSHRAIGGVSMGAASVNIALASEERFDLAAGLGGYMDLRYMMTTSHRLQLSGFCPLEQLEANLEDLNDPDAPGLQDCGPMKAVEELESED